MNPFSKMTTFTCENVLRETAVGLTTHWWAGNNNSSWCELSKLDLPREWASVTPTWSTTTNSTWTEEYLTSLQRVFPNVFEVAKLVTVYWHYCTLLSGCDNVDDTNDSNFYCAVLREIRTQLRNTGNRELCEALLASRVRENHQTVSAWNGAAQSFVTRCHQLPFGGMEPDWVNTNGSNMMTSIFGSGACANY
jgi:hypothetical protein